MSKAFAFNGRSRRASLGITLIVGIAVGCGSTGSQGGDVGPSDQFRSLPVEATPDLTFVDLHTDWRAAPIEGTPEETAIELGR